MKNIFKYILTGLSLLSVSAIAFAQNVENGIGTNKTVGLQDEDGNYTITLEAWAKGGTTVVTSAAPADIVLVLDLSQSMTSNYGSSVSYDDRTRQGYSYQSYGNNQYYYRHTDGEYYRVSRGYYQDGGNGNNGTRHYYLTFEANGTTYYLYGNTVTTERPSEPSGTYNQRQRQWQNTGETIWTGVLYNQTTTNISRLEALQDAVESFVEVIYHNDNYKDDNTLRDEPLGNRLSIVTFGGPQNNTNVTKINSNLTLVTNADRTKNTSMIADLLALTNNGIDNNQHHGTYADEGMALANRVLGGIDSERIEESSRTVILFTDGAPGSGPGWTTGTGATNSIPTANRAIAGPNYPTEIGGALKAKTDYDATVYTVVLGGIDNTDMAHYLDYTSSNYPEATSLSYPGQAAGGEIDYSKEAGDNLAGIFTEIAHASGGSERPVGSDTQVRDVVSSSFVIPDGFNTNDVVFKVFDVVSINDNTWVENTTYDKSGISAVIGTNAEGKSTLTVEGFDYSLDDNPKNSGNGNWVGPRYIGEQYVDKGRKLQIQFKIKSIGGATGGDGTNTNDPASGVYVKDAQGNYVCLNSYDMPHADLPIILVIKKTGLKHGESATFEIERCRPLHWDESKTLAENKAAMEYNAIGKPKPDGNWKDWSKVILTNKGEDRAEVEKKLMALDPHYIYRVAEDKWSWAYDMTGAMIGNEIPNTSTVEVNPFTFENRDKDGVVKHAEAVSINHFGYTIQTGEFQGKQEEHYKSSKVKSFENTTGGGSK